MLKNYFKIAWRSLISNKQSTILNLFGLSTGLACTLLIYLWVSDEVSVDKFNTNDSRIYQVMENSTNSDGSIFTSPITQGQLAKTMADELPEVEYSVPVIKHNEMGIVAVGEKRMKATTRFAGENFFKIFSYKLLAGNMANPLGNKKGVLVSNRLALRLFNTTQNIVGKTVNWDQGDNFNGLYIIAGVFEAPPASATDQFDLLFSFGLYADKKAGTMGDITYWGSHNTFTYILLKQGTNINHFASKIKAYAKEKIKTLYPGNDMYTYEGELFLQRYSDRYLYNHYDNGIQSGGRIEYVKLFSIIAIFILVIACINFMNLSTAKASKRMKEVGVRKVIGATRRSLIVQYMSESVLMALLSLCIALLMVTLLLGPFRQVTGKQLILHFNAAFIISVLAITLITGVIAGSYPALYLSGFKPVLVLKGALTTSAGESWVRKGLVVFQFVISVVLILSVLVVHKQMNLIQTKNLGYNKDNIIHFNVEGRLKQGLETFIGQVKNMPGVVNASSMDGDMTGGYSQGGGGIGWPGKTDKDGIEFEGLDMDYGMMEMLGLQMKEGRMFSHKFGADSNSVIFNETAIAAMHLKNPVGKTVTMWGKPKQIVGVIKDFTFHSLYSRVGPFFLRCSQDNKYGYVKIKAGAEKETLARLEAFYKQYNLGLPFEYKFLDEDYAALYASEQRVAVLSQYFAGLAIIISCLGLFGLVAFTAQKRQKEIGIRKVIGASVPNVVMLLSKDFLQLVLVAVLIAFPLAWWAMHSWLQSFAYRVNIGAGVFILTAAAIVCITIFTISFQAIKAALMNPVTAIRAE